MSVQSAPSQAPNLPPVLLTQVSQNGSPHPERSRPKRQSKLLPRLLVGLLFSLLATGAVVAYWLSLGPKGQRTDLIIHRVKFEPLRLTVVERGALESADNREVTCRVKAGTKASALSIKWVIDDGSQVKSGERLMEIDDSALQDALKAQKIVLDQARAAMIAAEESYKIVTSQNESDIAQAEIAITLAELDLKKYLEGEYIQNLKDIEGRLKVADADLKIQQERTAWASRMVTRDYLSQSQFKSEQSRLESLDVALKKIEEEKRVLNEFTKVRMETDLSSKVTEAKRALIRVKDQARAKEVQANSDRNAKKSVFEQEEDKYEDIEDQIRKCVITSPQDGMVVYYVSEQSRFGSGSQQSIIAQGEPVKEGQKLMRIPDLRRMLVNTKVHEAMVSRVKGDVWQPTYFTESTRAGLLSAPDGLTRLLCQAAMPEIRERLRDHEMQKVADGMKATVRIDAFPDRALRGHVKSVATVAAQQDWSSSDVKVYQTMIAIEESLEGLKPGMSAEVTIHIEATDENVLTVPLQAVVGGAELGEKRKVFVNGPEGPKEREVIIGLSNEKMVEIRSGLKENEEVILNPRVLIGDKMKTRQVVENDRQGGIGGGGKGDGKKKGGKGGPPKGGDGGMPNTGPQGGGNGK
ncbi:MAG: hypothetical protein U0746_01395 [Gemmataceae bacterium]